MMTCNVVVNEVGRGVRFFMKGGDDDDVEGEGERRGDGWSWMYGV